MPSSIRATASRVALFSILAAALVSPALAQAQPKTMTDTDKATVLKSIRRVVESEAFVPNVDFSQWNKFISGEQQDIAKAKTQDDFALAVQKALSDFGFSHLYILSPTVIETRLDHHLVGIGIQFLPQKDGILITKVFPDSPASHSGIVIGDRITSVEGKKDFTPDMIRGAEGTTVSLSVVSPAGNTRRVKIERKSISLIEPATLNKLDSKTDILTLPTFDNSYSATDIGKLLKKADGTQCLIVDLRGNPGGYVSNLMNFLSFFLPDGTPIGTFVGKLDTEAYQKNHSGKLNIVEVAKGLKSDRQLVVQSMGNKPYKGTVCVLVNPGSGSAAEMAAAALREKSNSLVVGTNSAGAVLVSIIQDLPDEFKIQFPIRDYVTIGGVRLEGNGIKPDFVVEDPQTPTENDPVIARAQAIVEKLHETIAQSK